jgi:hypothetical protein
MFVTKLSSICQSGSARGSRPESIASRSSSTRSQAFRTRAAAFAFTTGVVLAVTSVAHAQSTSGAGQSSGLAPLRRGVSDQQVPLPGGSDAIRQRRPLDRYLQNLGDEILRRAGASDAR